MTYFIIATFTAGLVCGYAARSLVGFHKPLPPYLTTFTKGGRK